LGCLVDASMFCLLTKSVKEKLRHKYVVIPKRKRSVLPEKAASPANRMDFFLRGNPADFFHFSDRKLVLPSKSSPDRRILAMNS